MLLKIIGRKTGTLYCDGLVSKYDAYNNASSWSLYSSSYGGSNYKKGSYYWAVDDYIFSSNYRIKSTSGQLTYGITYSLELETYEPTPNSVRVHTNWFSNSQISNYSVMLITNSYLDDNEIVSSNDSISITLTDIEQNQDETNKRFYFDLTSNGNYVFVFYYDVGDMRSIDFVELTVDNITNSSSGEEITRRE